MAEKENGGPSLETLPLDWFPDRAAVRAFVQGPRYNALRDLVLSMIDMNLPKSLAFYVEGAAFFVGKDLFELSRVAAIPGEERFEYSEMDPEGYDREWRNHLSWLITITLKDDFPEIIEMLEEASTSRREAARATTFGPSADTERNAGADTNRTVGELGLEYITRETDTLPANGEHCRLDVEGGRWLIEHSPDCPPSDLAEMREMLEAQIAGIRRDMETDLAETDTQ